MPLSRRFKLSSINFQRTYQLSESYESIKERAKHVLEKYREYPNLFTFIDADRSVTFTTERLIPMTSTKRLRVMLLFSNPHPHSIYQGMFLSPTTRGRESLFWPVMKEAGWIITNKEKCTPKQLADICVNVKYKGPFELIFNCYYAFPTNYPQDIKKIFGRDYFSQFIEPESKHEFREIIQDTNVDAVLTFNKGIFNLVSEDQIERYIDRLIDGELIQSQIKDADRYVPIFLTFPTGWRYRKQYMDLRKTSLETIKSAICSDSNITGRKTTSPQ
jgi:hypothetical protein